MLKHGYTDRDEQPDRDNSHEYRGSHGVSDAWIKKRVKGARAGGARLKQFESRMENRWGQNVYAKKGTPAATSSRKFAIAADAATKRIKKESRLSKPDWDRKPSKTERKIKNMRFGGGRK